MTLLTNNVSLIPLTPDKTTVGVVSSDVVLSNPNRKGLYLVNDSTAKIYLAFGAPAAVDNGLLLNPGDAFKMDGFCFTTEQVNAVATAPGSHLTIQEFF